jgi:photosystem II PsbJ protein
MSGEARIPLWVVAVVAGLGAIAVVGLFFYGAYAGVGSAV